MSELGTQVRIGDGELDAILREAFGERRHGIVAALAGEGVINDTRHLTWPDGTQRYLRIAPSVAFAEAGPSWFSAHGLRREAAVIAAASDLQDVLPVTVAHDFDGRVIDRDWVIQDAMPGQSLRELERGRSVKQREDTWIQVGQLTRRLHDIKGPHFGPLAWGPTCDRWSDLLMLDANGLIADAERFGYDSAPFERLASVVEARHDLLDKVTEPRLIHSDLCRAHIFARRSGSTLQLTGLIDLEFGRYADPLSEALITGFAWGNGPVEMEPAFMHAYAPEGFTAEDRERIGIYAALALGWFVPLLAMGNEPLDDLLARFGVALDRAESGE